MATITLREQKQYPYRAVTMAQLKDALITYSEDQTAVAGLNAIISAKETQMSEWPLCVQCGGKGKIEANAIICPLCSGEGKTEATYRLDYGPLVGFKTVEVNIPE